ncbi:MAG: hypothetical protein BroJett040_25760 [Oligoflexia bacterium]|nr:MAG: hypothetical protein BroJett040_25760 [Oligoflexia bacterium]
MKPFLAIFGLLFFFALGVFITYQSQSFKNSNLALSSSSPSRDPAAIKKVYDFSHLDGSALDSASKQRLISGTRVHSQNGDVGVELGHFVVRGDGGAKLFACQKYSSVTLQFEGDGVATGGEKPSMEVEGNCEISADINSIAPLWIPVARILGEPVSDGEFDYRDEKPIRVRFSNVVDQWPPVWRLISVKLSDRQNSQGDVIIDEKELKKISDRPVFVDFRSGQ